MEHDEAEWRLADLARGYLSDAEAESVEAHLDRCAACRATFARVQALLVVVPRASRPASRRSRRGWFVAAGVALAAATVLGVLTRDREPPELGLRGVQPTGETEVGLDLAIQRGESLERLHRDRRYAVGDHVQFVVSANPAAEVFLWVRVGDELEAIARGTATPEGMTLTRDGAPLTWPLATTASHRFFLSTTGYGECDPACASATVQVQP